MKEPYLRSVGSAATADRSACLLSHSLVTRSTCSTGTQERLSSLFWGKWCGSQTQESQCLWPPRIAWERQFSRLSDFTNKRYERTTQRLRQVPTRLHTSLSETTSSQCQVPVKSTYFIILYIQLLVINSCLFMDC